MLLLLLLYRHVPAQSLARAQPSLHLQHGPALALGAKAPASELLPVTSRLRRRQLLPQPQRLLQSRRCSRLSMWTLTCKTSLWLSRLL